MNILSIIAPREYAAITGSIYLPQRTWGMHAYHQACLELLSATNKTQEAARCAHCLAADPIVIWRGLQL